MNIFKLLILLFIFNCGQIREYRNITPNLNRKVQIQPGGYVFKIFKTQDLPNAFGGADIYGGKIDRGGSQLIYLGLESKKLIFNLLEYEIRSNETTMSRYGNTSVSANHQIVGNHIYSSYQVHEPPKSNTYMLPPNSFTFSIDPAKTNILNFTDVTVELIEWKEDYLIFKISNKTGINYLD
jgi:hypothetical protein